MATYVLSDVHGNQIRYEAMLSLIDFKEEDTLYVLGDVVDRGPSGIALLESMMNQHNVHLLMGNHEAYLIDRIKRHGFDGSHFQNNMSHETIRDLRKINTKRRFKILHYLKHLPYYHSLEIHGRKILLVHAGTDHIDPEKADPDFMVWAREEFMDEGPEFPYLIIHGHTPVQTIPGATKRKIYHYRNRINVDCGAFIEDGALACLRLEDMEEFYV